MPDPSAPVLVRCACAAGVSTITLDSPANANALSVALVDQLSSALAAAGADDDVRAVVLTHTGRTFCSGADLKADPAAPPPPGGGLAGVLAALAHLPKPVVARVAGAVRGGGMGLVAACDVALASTAASFAFSEVRVGVAPAMIAVPVLRVMAARPFAAAALSGDVFGAEAAAASGLLTEAVAPADLDARVEAVLDGFRRAAPGALAATKALLLTLRHRPLDEALAEAEALSARLFASPEAAEGRAAFAARRAPAWVLGGP